MGYQRQQKEEWKRARMVSYYALVATGAVDTRKVSIEKFMPLDEPQKKTKVSNTALEAFKLAQQKYLEQTENGSRT